MKQVYPTFILNTNDGSAHPFLVCVPDMVLVSEKCTSTKYVILSIFFCKQGVNRPVVLV